MAIQQLWASGGRTREPIFNEIWYTTANLDYNESYMFENIRNAITRLPMDRLGLNLGGRITLCSRHVILRLPWQRPLPSNGALAIQQLWASGGRTREPIFIKFGTQQQT